MNSKAERQQLVNNMRQLGTEERPPAEELGRAQRLWRVRAAGYIVELIPAMETRGYDTRALKAVMSK